MRNPFICTTRSPGTTVAASAALAIITILMLSGTALASEDGVDSKSRGEAHAKPLSNTYLVKLTFEDGGKALEFSTVTATRHFSMAPSERRIRLRGRFWLQADGRELLEFSLELGEQIVQPDGSSAVSRGGSWSGSTYFEPGKAIEIVKSPTSTITISLSKQ